MDRRSLIIKGGKLILTAAALQPLHQAGAVLENPNFKKPFVKNMEVIALTGRAFLEGYPVKVGDKLLVNSQIITKRESEISIRMHDGGLIKIGGESIVDISLDNTGTHFELIRGNTQTIIPSFSKVPYFFKTEYLNIRLLESVSFFQKIREGTGLLDKEGKAFKTEEENGYYFCLCNGNADIIRFDRKRNVGVLKSDHHLPYFLYEKDQKVYIRKTELLNHNDRQIIDLFSLDPGEELYPMDWLDQDS